MIEIFILAVLMALNSIGIILLIQKKLNDKISGLMTKLTDLKDVENLIERNKQALDSFSYQSLSLKRKINELENEQQKIKDKFNELIVRLNHLDIKISRSLSQISNIKTVSRHLVMNNLY